MSSSLKTVFFAAITTIDLAASRICVSHTIKEVVNPAALYVMVKTMHRYVDASGLVSIEDEGRQLPKICRWNARQVARIPS